MKVDSWVFFTLLAGLSWGTYVPLIFYGGSELGGKPGARIMAGFARTPDAFPRRETGHDSRRGRHRV